MALEHVAIFPPINQLPSVRIYIVRIHFKTQEKLYVILGILSLQGSYFHETSKVPRPISPMSAKKSHPNRNIFRLTASMKEE